MNVILLERVNNLGDLGDEVAVKAGFARNCLLPQGKAVPATRDNVASARKTGDRGSAHFQSRSISKSSPRSQKSKIASVPRRSRQSFMTAPM